MTKLELVQRICELDNGYMAVRGRLFSKNKYTLEKLLAKLEIKKHVKK